MSYNSLQYPIGPFEMPTQITDDMLSQWVDILDQFPSRINSVIRTLTEEQLELHYRPGGWSIRQVVHHCADSHMNSFIRFKLALTEHHPQIKPYREDLWAELADTKHFSISSSLQILSGVHVRWVHLIRSLSKIDLAKTYFHPESQKSFTLIEAIALYAWHCNHHESHILTCLK